MADLSESQASQSVKIVGANPSTGVEDNYIEVDTSGRITSKAQLQDNAGTGITSTTLGSTQRLDINGVPILDTSGSGTITSGTTPNDVVVATTSGCSSVIFNVTGTWVGTIRAEGLYGDGTTWTLITATDASQSVFSTSTSNDRWTIACGGFSQVRLRMSSYTSGSASVVWTSSVGSGAPLNIWNTNATSLKVTPRSDVLNLTGSAGSLNADAVAAIDVGGYASVNLQITGTWVGTLTFQGSNDNSNFVSVNGINVSNSPVISSTSTTVNGIFYIPLLFRYFRCRMTSYTSGTATSTYTFETITPNDIQGRNVGISDGTDIGAVTTNGDQKVVDGLRNGGVYGNLVLTTANTTYEAKVGGARLANRKSLTITALDAMFWGYDSSVTTSTGTPLAINQVVIFSIDPDSTFQIWLVASASSKNARITESP